LIILNCNYFEMIIKCNKVGDRNMLRSASFLVDGNIFGLKEVIRCSCWYERRFRSNMISFIVCQNVKSNINSTSCLTQSSVSLVHYNIMTSFYFSYTITEFESILKTTFFGQSCTCRRVMVLSDFTPQSFVNKRLYSE